MMLAIGKDTLRCDWVRLLRLNRSRFGIITCRHSRLGNSYGFGCGATLNDALKTQCFALTENKPAGDKASKCSSNGLRRCPRSTVVPILAVHLSRLHATVPLNTL